MNSILYDLSISFKYLPRLFSLKMSRTRLAVLVAVIVTLIYVGYLVAPMFMCELGETEIPSELKPLYDMYSECLSEKLVEWEPSEWRPMMFNGHHILASGIMVQYTDEEIDRLFLDMLCELNVDTVSLYILKMNYDRYTKRYDRLIQMIREQGKKLILHAYALPRKNETIDEFFDRLLEYKIFLVEKYRPEYFVVLMEPSEIGGIKMPVEKLREFTIRAIEEIKRVSPDTVPLFIVHKWELNLLPHFIDIDGLDIIGINLYGIRGIENVEQALEYLKEHGKRPWIFETWWISQKKGGEHHIWFRDCYWQGIASKWIRAITYLVQKHNLEGNILNPFFTEQFVYCNGKTNTPFEQQFEGIIKALKNGDRTLIFQEFKKLIEDVKGYASQI